MMLRLWHPAGMMEAGTSIRTKLWQSLKVLKKKKNKDIVEFGEDWILRC